MGIRRRALFLKWCVINLVSTTVILVATVLVGLHLRNVSGWTIGFAALIGVVYLVAEIHACRISWNTDTVIETGQRTLELKLVRHSARSINIAANVCPLIGLLGTLIGIIISMGGLDAATVNDFEQAKHAAMSGVGVAMISTASGVYAAIVLIVVHSVIKHSIDMPLPDKNWI